MLICRLVASACWHRPRGWSDSVPKAPDPGRALKTPITAGLLNDRVVPFFDETEVKLSRVLTGRGIGYCGNPGHHEYELYLAVEDIDHFRTKTKGPQTSGIAERFHKTVLVEFYRIAFRKRLYASIEDCRTASIYGSKATTRRDRIRAAGASASRRCKHSLTAPGCEGENDPCLTAIGSEQATSKRTLSVRSSTSYITLHTVRVCDPATRMPHARGVDPG
jgi:hypothetical protein